MSKFTRTTPPNGIQKPVLPPPLYRQADGAAMSDFAAVSGLAACDTGNDRIDLPAAAPRDAADRHAELNKLLLNVRDGCQRSFDLFYDKTRTRLLRSVQNIIRNRDDAADVLQDVYTKVWGRSAQFQHDKGHALNWALGIAHHTAVSSLRMRAARPQTVGVQTGAGDDGEDPYAAMESPCLPPDELAIRAQACRAVQRAVYSLPDAQREAVLLAFYEGLSYDEVAQRMRRPLGTIKSWIRRSLAALQPAMAMHHDTRVPAPRQVPIAAALQPRRRAPAAATAMPAMA